MEKGDTLKENLSPFMTVVFLVIAVTGILCGAILGTTAARIAKQKLVQSEPEAGSS